MPTRNFRRRPNWAVAASTFSRTSASPSASVAAALPTPVGARYSPKTSRMTWPHSPVVAPALAAAMEAGMTLRPSCAAARRSASADWTAALSRASRQAVRRAIWSASTLASTGQDVAFARGQRRWFGFLVAVDADDRGLASFDPGQPLGVGRHQRALHVVDCSNRTAHYRRCGPVPGARLPSGPRPSPRQRGSRRRDHRIPAGPSRRLGSAACAVTIAGPRGAAGPAPRSRREAARRGRGRSSRASPPVSPAGCGRRYSRAVAR